MRPPRFWAFPAGMIMIVIGEKINGTLKKTAAAIAARDAAFIQDLARRQVAAGADYLDVNAGTAPDHEPEDLAWLIQTVQAAVGVPLCLDSPNPAALAAGLGLTRQPPFINSISGEDRRLEGTVPLIAGRSSGVIALLLSEGGVPHGVDGRLAVARKILAQTRRAGIPDERVFVDPLVMAVGADKDGGVTALQTMRAVRAECPSVRFCIGLSNISFGLPARSLLNRALLTLALEAGLDAAIIDPLDAGVQAALLAAEVVLGRDRFCRKYTAAFRAGRIA